MFNFLKNLFKPKNVQDPHPLDGPVRAATEKAALPEPVVVQAPAPVVEPDPAPVTPAPVSVVANNTHWPFPTSAPAAEAPKEKKPRKPRAPKAVVMSTQPKKKK